MARLLAACACLASLLGLVVAPAAAGATTQPATGAWRVLIAGDADVYDSLRLPSGVAVDADGGVYAVDTANSRLLKLSRTGGLLAIFGAVGTGPTELRRPRGAVVDAQGVVYVADTANFRVQRFSASGEALGPWGEIGSAPGEFILPEGVALDEDGNLYVADTGNHRVQELSPTPTSGGQTVAMWSQGLHFPHALALDHAGHVYVTDAEGLKELALATGDLVRQWTEFSDPYGVALDGDGNIFVADTDHARVVELSPEGEPIARWGTEGSAPGQFRFPQALAVDPAGRVYVADRGNNRIQVLVR